MDIRPAVVETIDDEMWMSAAASGVCEPWSSFLNIFMSHGFGRRTVAQSRGDVCLLVRRVLKGVRYEGDGH